MQKIKHLTSKQSITALVIAALLMAGLVTAPLVRADRFQDEINAINQQTASTRGSLDQLGNEAASLADVIGKLQTEINVLQGQIQANQVKRDETIAKITAAEVELARQKALLSENIKQMYLEGDISTVEMLFSSKDLSEYVDKEQYRTTVKNKIKDTLDSINALKVELAIQKEAVEKLLADQRAMQGQLSAQQGEQNRLLNLNQAQQSALDSQIKSNNSRVVELRRQQAIENAKHGNGVIAGDPSRGGYPSVWANSAQDSMIDSWGMYNRECVSYAAWRVYQSGKYMQYWGGRGNANQWPDNMGNKDHNPQPGDVAVAYWGYYGHVMYVEAVSGNSVYVSQYNYGIHGEYSEMWVNTSDIDWFLHF